MRRIALVIVAVLGLALSGCESEKGGQNTAGQPRTYAEAVKQIRRPPTSSRALPDGGLEATWETQVRGGYKRLIMTFDSDRNFESWREEFRK